MRDPHVRGEEDLLLLVAFAYGFDVTGVTDYFVNGFGRVYGFVAVLGKEGWRAGEDTACVRAVELSRLGYGIEDLGPR